MPSRRPVPPSPARAPRLLAALLTGALALAAAAPVASAQSWTGDDPAEDPAPGRSEPAPAQPDSRGLSVRAGLGFTADPTTFLLHAAFPIELGPRVALAPNLDLGVDDDHVIFAPTLDLEARFDLSEVSDDPALRRVQPFVSGGLGFAYIHRDRRGDDDDEVGPLLAAGLGLEVEVQEDLFVGSQMRFNVLPVETSGEHFYFAWHLASVRVAF